MMTLEAMWTGMWCGIGLVGCSAVCWIATVFLLVRLVGKVVDALMADAQIADVPTSPALAEAP
jgi:hypothetical protein